jgi:hypothetical protein
MSIASENLGPCCACHKIGPTVRNIIMLNKKAPIPGKGWGCVQCGLEADGAIAVLCDRCHEGGATYQWACSGYPGEGDRVPIDSLTGTHEHDVRFHPL